MTKAGESILRGAQQALEYARGADAGFVVHLPDTVDVKAVRKKMGLSQPQFARAFGFSVSAIQNWEQNKRTPDPAARAYLLIIDREPDAVKRALGA